ncbi:hypothetical protein [Odoribacter laneus]|uniref:hypothetical protein n=1 Tax=Odoribacter laneus TaxID=626933 RepID=UPI0023F08B2B|nr:hypothetical protein [Odoribacter laneus]
MKKCLMNTFNLGIYRKNEISKLFKKRWKKYYDSPPFSLKEKRIGKELKEENSRVLLTFFRKLLDILIIYKGDKKECLYRVFTILEQNLVSEIGRKLWCDLINYCYYGIIEELQRCHPDLKEEEIEFVCLMGIGLSIEELGFLYNMSNKGSVYTKSYRIRKQMGLTCSIDIYVRKKIESLKNTAENKSESIFP